MFQIPKENTSLKIKWGARNPLWWMDILSESNAKHTRPTRKYPTWNADVASVSKTSWGTPGCRTAVNTERCSGSFNFTCKFNVDIALKTLLFLACVNFFLNRFHCWSIAHPFGRSPILKLYHPPCFCRSPIQWSTPDLFILWNLNCLLSLQHLPCSTSSAIQV